jgi:hypothetical protein
MLLLVVGLVVIVLVILVVVFLSVRSMRAEEGGDHPARPAGRGRADGARDDFASPDRGGASRRRETGRQPARRGPAQDEWPADREPVPAGRSARAATQRRFGSLPRPRGHQHDQDPEPGGPDDRDDTRRGSRQESVPRLADDWRDRTGADRSADDWGGVSDEQYWAELAADKPLATTARSVQPGLDARPAAALRDDALDAGSADAADRWSGRDEHAARPQRGHAATVTAAAAPTAQFSLRAGPGLPDRQPDALREPLRFPEPAAVRGSATPAEPRTGPMSTDGGVDTDPGIGGIGWRPAESDGTPAAQWQAPDTAGPAAWDPGTRPAEDPLTSPSFAAPNAYSADSRSYRGSHDRAQPHYEAAADVLETDRYGAPGYQTDPAWGRTNPAAAVPSYGGRADDWRGQDSRYPGISLEPLPEPSGSWYSAPTPSGGRPSYPEPSGQARDQHDDGYQSGPRHDPYPGQQSWPAAEPYPVDGASYGRAADHGGGHHRDTGPSGYRDVLAGYGPSGDGPGENGYDEPGRGSGDVGVGYGQPDYGPGQAGYRRSKHSLPDAGYDQPAHDPRYQRPGNGADARYERPDYDSGTSREGLGQGSGYGHYPGYDGRG